MQHYEDLMTMRKIGESKIGNVNPKPNFRYPVVRFPKEYTDIIGHQVAIYETKDESGRRAFMLVLDDDSIIPKKVIQQSDTTSIEKRIDGLENKINQVLEFICENKKQDTPEKTWARRDSNSRSSPCEGDVIAN